MMKLYLLASILLCFAAPTLAAVAASINNPCVVIGSNSYYMGDLTKPCASTTYYNDPQGGSCACCKQNQTTGVCDSYSWAKNMRVAAGSPLIFGQNQEDGATTPQCCSSGCGSCYKLNFFNYNQKTDATCLFDDVSQCQQSLSVMIVNSCFDATACPPKGQMNRYTGMYAHFDILDYTGWLKSDYGWTNPYVWYQPVPCDGSDGLPTDRLFSQCTDTCQNSWNAHCPSKTVAPAGNNPASATQSPTQSPSQIPTQSPTQYPTQYPTSWPSASPTLPPYIPPTFSPTSSPSSSPSTPPSAPPSPSPTSYPTNAPTSPPVVTPPSSSGGSAADIVGGCSASASVTMRSSGGWTENGATYNLFDVTVTNTGSRPANTITISFPAMAAIYKSWNLIIDPTTTATSGQVAIYQPFNSGYSFNGAGFILDNDFSVYSVSATATC